MLVKRHGAWGGAEGGWQRKALWGAVGCKQRDTHSPDPPKVGYRLVCDLLRREIRGGVRKAISDGARGELANYF